METDKIIDESNTNATQVGAGGPSVISKIDKPIKIHFVVPFILVSHPLCNPVENDHFAGFAYGWRTWLIGSMQWTWPKQFGDGTFHLTRFVLFILLFILHHRIGSHCIVFNVGEMSLRLVCWLAHSFASFCAFLNWTQQQLNSVELNRTSTRFDQTQLYCLNAGFQANYYLTRDMQCSASLNATNYRFDPIWQWFVFGSKCFFSFSFVRWWCAVSCSPTPTSPSAAIQNDLLNHRLVRIKAEHWLEADFRVVDYRSTTTFPSLHFLPIPTSAPQLTKRTVDNNAVHSVTSLTYQPNDNSIKTFDCHIVIVCMFNNTSLSAWLFGCFVTMTSSTVSTETEFLNGNCTRLSLHLQIGTASVARCRMFHAMKLLFCNCLEFRIFRRCCCCCCSFFRWVDDESHFETNQSRLVRH